MKKKKIKKRGGGGLVWEGCGSGNSGWAGSKMGPIRSVKFFNFKNFIYKISSA